MISAVDPTAPADMPSGSIPEWIMGKVVDLVVAAVNALPAGPDGDPMASGVGAALSTLLGHAASIGNWVPWSAFSTAGGFVMLGLGFAFTLKIVRIVISLFTVGGGSAG